MSIARSYFDEFIACSRAPDMLALGLFPDAKEVTESFGAYAAARRYLREAFPLNDPAVVLIAVGDGSTPRTGATFAMRSAWSCTSVDPRLHETSNRGVCGRPPSTGWGGVERLTVLPRRVEEVTVDCDGRPVLVVAVHSHASLAASIGCIGGRPSRVGVIAMPCCVSLVLPGLVPDATYEDQAILSPQRRVVVWGDATARAENGRAGCRA